jgi:hypothetical protein
MFIGEFDRVLMGNTVRHPCHGGTGGEWDTLRRIPAKTMRRLTAAGFFRKWGLEPDVAASDYIIPSVAGVEDTCAAMEWYWRMALRVLEERRRVAHHRRHRNLARANGFVTWFDYRNNLSKRRGFTSYRHERREKGWEG